VLINYVEQSQRANHYTKVASHNKCMPQRTVVDSDVSFQVLLVPLELQGLLALLVQLGFKEWLVNRGSVEHPDRRVQLDHQAE